MFCGYPYAKLRGFVFDVVYRFAAADVEIELSGLRRHGCLPVRLDSLSNGRMGSESGRDLTPLWEAQPTTFGLEKVTADVVQVFRDQPGVAENGAAHDHAWHHRRWMHAGDELLISTSG
jgi:hypothetical protein